MKRIGRKTKLRLSLWHKNPHCVWCGRLLQFSESTIEHVVRKCDLGGKLGIANLSIACAKCNHQRENPPKARDRPRSIDNERRYERMANAFRHAIQTIKEPPHV